MINPVNFIEVIRNSFSNSIEVYTEGSCYQFYLILKSIYPNAVAYYNSDHVITKIGNEFYDITGKVLPNKTYIIVSEHYSHRELKKLKC